MRAPLLILASALALVSCSTMNTDGAQRATSSKSSPASMTAILRDGQGVARGNAVIGGKVELQLTLNVTGLSAGPHGIHIHTVGKCEAPGFTTAGPHWNPTGHQHGRDNPAGAHSGDLPNIEIQADGRGLLVAAIPGTAVDLFDADGASIIIHAAADDYKTDPSGNSGARQLCGVFVRR